VATVRATARTISLWPGIMRSCNSSPAEARTVAANCLGAFGSSVNAPPAMTTVAGEWALTSSAVMVPNWRARPARLGRAGGGDRRPVAGALGRAGHRRTAQVEAGFRIIHLRRYRVLHAAGERGAVARS